MMAKSYRPAGVGMVPAAAGTYLLNAYFDDNQVDLVKSAVLGWQVSSERSLTPLLIDPRAADVEPWFVAHPDGRVEASDGRCWETVDQWIGEERRLRLPQSRLPQEPVSHPHAAPCAAPVR